LQELHLKESLFQPDDHTGAGFSSCHHTPVAVVPAVLPDGLPAHHNSRRLVDSCNRDNRRVVQNASASDNAAVQDNNNQVAMVLHAPHVQVSLAVQPVEHPVPLQDCPVVEAWLVFRQLAG
jgi:hypothetical protein